MGVFTFYSRYGRKYGQNSGQNGIGFRNPEQNWSDFTNEVYEIWISGTSGKKRKLLIFAPMLIAHLLFEAFNLCWLSIQKFSGEKFSMKSEYTKINFHIKSRGKATWKEKTCVLWKGSKMWLNLNFNSIIPSFYSFRPTVQNFEWFNDFFRSITYVKHCYVSINHFYPT